MMMNQEVDEESGIFFFTAGNSITEQNNTGGSTKRRLLFPSSSIFKKPNLSPSSPHFLNGFNQIQLPPTTLRRTISEPLNSICVPHSISTAQSSESLHLQQTLSDPTTALLFLQSPDIDMPSVTVKETTPKSLPPLRLVIHRKVSDAMSSGKMPKHLTKKESPNCLELKKMKNSLRLMSQWFSQPF